LARSSPRSQTARCADVPWHRALHLYQEQHRMSESPRIHTRLELADRSGSRERKPPLVEAIPAARGRRGRPCRRPDALYGDRGYDHDKYRKQVREVGITPLIARQGE
jgi:hypothetical protein